MGQIVDLDGQVFGFWQVMGRAPQHTKRTAANWWCLCICGAFKPVPGAALRNGQSISCGCTRTYSHIRKLPDDPEIYRARYVAYETGAARRDVEFALTLAEFIDIARRDCHYCGARPALPVRKDRKYGHQLMMSGIDRVQNDKGYTTTNCVACCTYCNAMKLDQNLADFVSRVKRIAARH